MAVNGYLYVSSCPLSVLRLCSWHSEPCTSDKAATEALRAHVDGHRHGDLVTFAAAHMDSIAKYRREEPAVS